MATREDRGNDLGKWVHGAIAQRLGDISDLPEVVRRAVYGAYLDFIAGYLDAIRQKEKRGADWFPSSFSLDGEVIEGMGHFFSDYQHITREFNRINRHLDRLKKLDPARQSRLFQQSVDEMLAGGEKAVTLEVIAG
jgi:hypothetical protein